MTLSPPSVVKTVGEDGTEFEPWESVTIESSSDHCSTILERLASRGAKVSDMQTKGDTQVMRFEVSTSGCLGMRSWIREVSGGTAVVHTEFLELRPAGPPPPRIRNGVLVANAAGIANAVDLAKASRLGTIFVPEGTEVYVGMIFGENSAEADIDTNVARKHDGYRSAGSMPPPRLMFLEQALAYIEEDEKLEITPKRVVMRKALLDPNERKASMKKSRPRA